MSHATVHSVVAVIIQSSVAEGFQSRLGSSIFIPGSSTYLVDSSSRIYNEGYSGKIYSDR